MRADEYALIVAGGKGARFGSHTPKQFLELKGKPVLLHTLEGFYRYNQNIQVVLVLPAQDIALWEDLARRNNFRRSVVIQEGGSTRFQSVRNGLQRIDGEGYVAIHDGVRPLVSSGIISKSFELARKVRAAVAAVPLKESLRVIDDTGGSTQAVDRSRYRMIQTPQTFEIALIRKAYEIDEDPALTDDASVAERAGYPVFLFEGDYRNIKITNPEDLAIAATLMDLPGKDG